MAVKLLGAIDITQNTWTDIYTVPSSKSVVVSKIIITNHNTSSDAEMRVAHLPTGQTIGNKYQIIRQTVLKNYGLIEITGGICLTAGDKLQVYSDQASGTCIAWGDEF